MRRLQCRFVHAGHLLILDVTLCISHSKIHLIRTILSVTNALSPHSSPRGIPHLRSFNRSIPARSVDEDTLDDSDDTKCNRRSLPSISNT